MICVIILPNKNDYDRGAPKEEYLCRAVLAGLGRVKGRGAEGPEAKGVPGRTENIRATVANAECYHDCEIPFRAGLFHNSG